MRAVVISGPESTGKSTLTMELAHHFSVSGVAEYARDYVERLKRPYNVNDVETIARRQVAVYKQMQRHKAIHETVFFDTFLIITKVWFQEVFKFCPVWLHQAIKENIPDLVLLCSPDISWTPDGIRENPERRGYLFDCYRHELGLYGISFKVVDGIGPQRLENAISVVNSIDIKNTNYEFI
jgi:nicotinamide riboside kinase